MRWLVCLSTMLMFVCTDVNNPVEYSFTVCPVPIDSPVKSPEVNMRYPGSNEPRWVPSGVNVDYSTFKVGIGWLQAVSQDCNGKKEDGYCDFREIRLYSVSRSGSRRLLEGVRGSDFYDNPAYGKLFTRDPWCGYLGQDIPLELKKENGREFVRMYPSEKPSKLFHWWTNRVLLPNDLAYMELEAEVRVSGKVWLQGGLDFWLSLTAPDKGYGVNNIESGVGLWVNDDYDDGWMTYIVSCK